MIACVKVPMPLEAPPDLTVALGAFLQACGLTLTKADAAAVLEKSEASISALTGVLEAAYHRDVDFDIDFLEKLHDYFKSIGLVKDLIKQKTKRKDGSTVETPSIIVLNMFPEDVNKTCPWTCGIARQVRKEDVHVKKSFGISQSPIADHALVLLKKTAGRWNIHESLATAEFKRKKKSCKLTTDQSRKRPREYIKRPKLDGQDGALSQIVAYTVTLNLLGHCRTGSPTNTSLPKKLPFVVLACESNENEKLDDQNNCRWILGNLLIPERCGDKFQFEVNSFQSFLEDDSGKTALAAYFQVLASGVSWAKGFHENETSLLSLSGQKLFFGDQQVTEYFQIYNIPESRRSDRITVTQGELWEQKKAVKLPQNWVGLNQDTEVEVFSFTMSPPTEGLIVKVFSPSIHNSLLVKTTQQTGLNSLCAHKEACSAINDVLVAVFFNLLPGSFVIVMNDIRTSHVALKPIDLKNSNEPGRLSQLWKNGMGPLVMEKLVPLARHNFVHCDIRGGFDLTANILISKDFSDTTGSTDPDLKLIDFESIVRFMKGMDLPDDLRYPAQLGMCHTALGFVWWQTVVIGCSWIFETSADDLDFADLVQIYPDASKNIDENGITAVFNKIERFLSNPTTAPKDAYALVEAIILPNI